MTGRLFWEGPRRIEELVDKMILSVVVRLIMSFWDDTHDVTTVKKLQFVMMTVHSVDSPVPHQHTRADTLLNERTVVPQFFYQSTQIDTGQDAERIVGVLTQFPELVHLDLRWGHFVFQSRRVRKFCRSSGTCTSISVAMESEQVVQRVLQECWRSALTHL